MISLKYPSCQEVYAKNGEEMGKKVTYTNLTILQYYKNIHLSQVIKGLSWCKRSVTARL
jgi:hypothetical protein